MATNTARSFLVLAMTLAALAASAAPAGEAAAVSAGRFVDRLYGIGGPPLPERDIYAPDLARLISRAEAVARRTEDPDLVGNALCDCQNLSELQARIRVVSATATAASVRVTLTGGVDGPARFLLKLVRGASGWRLSDSFAEPGGSYAANLRASLAEH